MMISNNCPRSLGCGAGKSETKIKTNVLVEKIKAHLSLNKLLILKKEPFYGFNCYIY